MTKQLEIKPEKVNAWVLLYRLTKEVREAQRNYFRDRSTSNLVRSKEAEKALDEHLKEIERIAKEKKTEL
jgi:hypothetical protein